MYLRFTKGKWKSDLTDTRKCVMFNDTVVMEYGFRIVGVAKLYQETDKVKDYDIIVSNGAQIAPEKIAAYIKNMISKSNKFTEHPSKKRRRYNVEYIDGESLPINAYITFKPK